MGVQAEQFLQLDRQHRRLRLALVVERVLDARADARRGRAQPGMRRLDSRAMSRGAVSSTVTREPKRR